jgi:hypothetical protein
MTGYLNLNYLGKNDVPNSDVDEHIGIAVNSATKVSPRRTAMVRIKFMKDGKSGIDKLAIVDGTLRLK